ncbi:MULTISPECIES: hypothetical protein [unclassified Streptococcus]|uniref:hypothetical protein n=1 Tax=unclassified Streptococcus TaxID=2608887 RepID=UPI0018AC7DCB|nr:MULTISPECIES: hypothetical protein [unclassified Streptococcus]MBF8970323.1 hypothetical protein [Streptococcus sp. NLN76]MBG9367095.1 hypothetical protein [Streptococcus sp. NLN64]MBJ6746110.1 hypothetical protein [Streptococcus sp. 121]
MKHSKIDKGHRQALIRSLIQQKTVRGQKEIMDFLASQGLVATQATVSRDLRELGIVKGGEVGYQVQPAVKKTPILHVMRQDNMISIQVTPGQALLFKKEVWSRYSSDIFTILSDDDTVLIVVKTGVDSQEMSDALENW